MKLNRKIAEARGFTVERKSPNVCALLLHDEIYSMSYNDAEETAWLDVPDYEGDLNAAWPLFWELPVSAVVERDRRDTIGTLSWWVNGGWQHVIFDGTQPEVLARAICEAWLRWQGIEFTG